MQYYKILEAGERRLAEGHLLLHFCDELVLLLKAQLLPGILDFANQSQSVKCMGYTGKNVDSFSGCTCGSTERKGSQKKLGVVCGICFTASQSEKTPCQGAMPT